MRFDEKITLTIDVPDELLSVQLPKLTLQPIIENSILHGILEKESGLKCGVDFKIGYSPERMTVSAWMRRR